MKKQAFISRPGSVEKICAAEKILQVKYCIKQKSRSPFEERDFIAVWWITTRRIASLYGQIIY
jgi:hypothetical protein